MNRVVFIDANVPIYAAGREHRYKGPCGRVLMMVAEHPGAFVTDAEVLQELVHRYVSSGRWSLGRKVLEDFAELMHSRVEPVHGEDVRRAGRLADDNPGVSARDLVHLAVMQRVGVSRIVTADTDFDRLPEVERLDPVDVDGWAAAISVPRGR